MRDLPFVVQAKALWSQRGRSLSSASTCGVNKPLKETAPCPAPSEILSLSYEPQSHSFDPHLSKSLCFSLFQLTLVFLQREKNSFLLLKRQAQINKGIGRGTGHTQCLTCSYVDTWCLYILHVDGQVSSEYCPFDHVQYRFVVLCRETAENLTPLRE